VENTTGIAQELENFLNNRENDSASSRAELAEFCVETIYKFVKFNRSEARVLMAGTDLNVRGSERCWTQQKIISSTLAWLR